MLQNSSLTPGILAFPIHGRCTSLPTTGERISPLHVRCYATIPGYRIDTKESLLRTNQAADFFLGQSPLLRSILAAYVTLHTHLEEAHARTYESQFATADEAQNLSATSIEAVQNDGRRSLLEAKTQKTIARQGSTSYVESSHIESPKKADLCKLHET
jgi:hypothetical protein